MEKFSKSELAQAFAHYRQVKNECSRTGNWSPFADMFTEDCYYIEHAYGDFKGREAVRQYIISVMAPFPTMTFEEDWIVYDEERGAIIWQLQNVFPPPNNPETGKPFAFPNISRLVYAGNMMFSEEQDWYNPSGRLIHVHAAPTTKAWRKVSLRKNSSLQQRIFGWHQHPLTIFARTNQTLKTSWQAGGKFLTNEKLKMMHTHQHTSKL